MTEFKCIGCGEIKKIEKACNCSTCGYKMYELPYDRCEILKDEIKYFLNSLMVKKINHDDLSIYRLVPKKGKIDKESQKEMFTVISKLQDDKVFPDFYKIRDYVNESSKTEIFIERLNNALTQIRKRINESRQMDYKTNLDKFNTRIKANDDILKKALKALDLQIELSEPAIPEIFLVYDETSNLELNELTNEIIDQLLNLSSIIFKFIKINNLYGTNINFKDRISFKPSVEMNFMADLEQISQTVATVSSKKYVVDILSDGSNELKEMLKTFWHAIFAILTLPVIKKRWNYSFSDGRTATETTINSTIIHLISGRYDELDTILKDNEFLSEKSEKQLFNLYNKMIELDSLGLMKINKDNLMRIGESEEALGTLIGLSSIKESMLKIKAYALSNKDNNGLNIHMCFYGNPGTGKTEVARIIADILYENKILPTKNLVEVDRGGLVGQYVGETAQKTMKVIDQAMGGVLFVDEAYALASNNFAGFDYGHEAIATLIKAMEDYRGKFCVIFAGYKNEMQQMLSTNPGFQSRIQFTLDFPNYSREELRKIAELMLKQRNYTITDTAIIRVLDITDLKRKNQNFANAREVRNILDQVVMCQNIRTFGQDNREIGIVDVNKYILDSKINLPTSGNALDIKILTGDDELNNLVGLLAVKKMIMKIKAYSKRNKTDQGFNLNMCFSGNPGTGKTEVARILSSILYNAGVLPEAKLVETDAHGLLGNFVGETAPKALAKINEAMNGVLFIDDAYSLFGNNAFLGASSNFGKEAVDILLKEMEDHRGQFCVILVGNQDEINTMFSLHPGLKSRIQFTLDFPDFTKEELGEITFSFLEKMKYEIDDRAFKKLLDVIEYYRNKPNFANAKSVRSILNQVILNQNLRTEDSYDNNLIVIDDVEEYVMDERIELSKTDDSVYDSLIHQELKIR